MTKPKFRTSRSFEDTQNFSKEPRADDIVDVLKYPNDEWLTVRAVGPVVAVGGHWVSVEPPKKDKKTKAFWAPCLAFNPNTEERDSTKKCAWCDDTSGWVRTAIDYWQNFIVRQLEEDKPGKEKEHTKKEEKTGFKEKGSKSWTPCKAGRIAPGFMRDLKKAASLNRHTSKKTGQKKAFPLSHEKFGVDLEIMYAPEEAPAKKYSLHKGEKRTPLNDDQQAYLLQPIESLSKVLQITAKAEDAGEDVEKALAAELKKQEKEYSDWSKRQLKKWKDEFGGSDEESDDDEDDDDKPKGKGKKGKKSTSAKGKSKDEDEDDDESSDDDDDDNEFDSDKKKSKSKKSKKKSRDEDDDEDEDEDDEDEDSDDDEDDEDEDDEPKSKKKSKSKGKKSKKSKKSRDDDDDEDDEDEDEDDDD